MFWGLDTVWIARILLCSAQGELNNKGLTWLENSIVLNLEILGYGSLDFHPNPGYQIGYLDPSCTLNLDIKLDVTNYDSPGHQCFGKGTANFNPWRKNKPNAPREIYADIDVFFCPCESDISSSSNVFSPEKYIIKNLMHFIFKFYSILPIVKAIVMRQLRNRAPVPVMTEYL